MLREEIMRPQSSLKSHSLPHYITGFFFLLSSSIFFFFFLDSWKCSRKPSGQGNCRLLKLRILCFSWSDMSRLNILHWKNLWASKRRLSARLLNLVKSQSTVKENYLLFSKQMEWLRTCYVLSWKSEEESTQDLQLVSSISRNTSIQSGKSTSLGF